MVTGFYVLANVAYFAVLTPNEILLSPAVATVSGIEMKEERKKESVASAHLD